MQVLEHLKQMSEESFLALYEFLSEKGFGPLDREVAVSLKFRPQAIRKLPMPQRARRARMILTKSGKGELAYELFGSYLIKKDKALITDFLDQTGVAHEDGMIEDVEAASPEVEKIEPALAALDEKYGAADVTLYLSMCAAQWPDVPELDAAWRARLENAGSAPGVSP